jgi:hypothetical protein
LCAPCHNPSPGLVIKARVCKGAGQERSPGIASHVPGSVEECEGMNPHTPKGTLTLGVGVSVDSQIFRKQLQGSKTIGLRRSLYHWKALGTKVSEMGLHDPFWHLKNKLWPKEGLGVELAIWLPTTKSQESSQFPCVKVACCIQLKSSWQGLQLCLRPDLNRRSAEKVMGPQSCESPTWESWDKMPFGCGPRGEAQNIL